MCEQSITTQMIADTTGTAAALKVAAETLYDVQNRLPVGVDRGPIQEAVLAANRAARAAQAAADGMAVSGPAEAVMAYATARIVFAGPGGTEPTLEIGLAPDVRYIMESSTQRRVDDVPALFRETAREVVGRLTNPDGKPRTGIITATDGGAPLSFPIRIVYEDIPF